MNKFLLSFILCLCIGNAFAQSDTMYVNGRFLYNHAGEKITLKGINYPVLDDWNFPGNMNNGNERMKEIEKTKANTVRLEWYNNYGQPARPAYTLAHLDSLLTRAARMRMIPVTGLWDVTCSNDWNAFATAVTAWWTQPPVVSLFKKHKRYSIINLANEFGYYAWAGGDAAALNNYKNNYKAVITAMRNAGYTQPIMIDAADCGTNADVQIAAGAEMLAHDPLHNIILSVHAYWTGFTGNDSTVIANKVQQMVNSNLPFVFGEIANYQADATPCQYALNYSDLLETLQQKDIGWYAWAWYKDGCAAREMTATGLFADMGSYGSDITNNTVYGLTATALRRSSTFDDVLVVAATGVDINVSCGSVSNRISVTATAINIDSLILLESNDARKWIRAVKKQEQAFNIDQQKSSLKTYYKALAYLPGGRTMESRIAYCSGNVQDVNIYPNPSTGRIYISNNNFYTRMNVRDALGQNVISKNIIAGKNVATDLSHLTPGIYTVQFSGRGGSDTINQKLVIIK